MSLLHEVHQRGQERGLRFLLIGGFAVNAHGHSRLTGDLDLAVPKADQDPWRDLVQSMGYRLSESNDRFLQFEPQASGRMPIDLNEPTFAGLWTAATEVRYDDRLFRVVSLDHLIAMKLHVLKQGKLHHPHQFHDVLQVLEETNNLELHSEKFRSLFTKYGNMQLYEKALRLTDQSKR